MTTEHSRLKLGKRASFVKTHLKQLPQEAESWEADFRAMPKPRRQRDTHYLGLVVAVPQGDPLVYLPVEYTPTVNDLADLLADAMRRPLTGSARRPEGIHILGNPRWEELFPHLKQLGIEVTIQDELLELEAVCLDFLREIRRAGSGPIIMLSPGRTQIAKSFPAVAVWVQGYGHIEIGDQEGFGFIARALDYGGLVFEDDKPKTLVEALVALENGLTEWFNKQGIEVEGS